LISNNIADRTGIMASKERKGRAKSAQRNALIYVTGQKAARARQ